jgi:cell division protein FtsQ
MARKQSQQSDRNEERFLNIRRGLIIATLASIALMAVLWGAMQLEHFLIRDPQFTLAAPPDPGEESPTVSIAGLKHSDRNNVSSIFDRDFGRSIYLMPLRQRREELLRLQWVKDARVTRVWPNRLQIRITEREPVAFVQLPGESTLPLIDTDGHILRPESPGNKTMRSAASASAASRNW